MKPITQELVSQLAHYVIVFKDIKLDIRKHENEGKTVKEYLIATLKSGNQEVFKNRRRQSLTKEKERERERDWVTLNSMAADSLRAEIASRSAFSFSVIGSDPASIHSAIDSQQKN